MSFVIVGKNTLAAECLEILVRNNENVAAVVGDSSDSDVDSWQRSLRYSAKKAGIPFLAPHNSRELAKYVHKLNPEVIFSLQAPYIFREDVLELPSRGCFNIHFSLLPAYRGCYPGIWAIIRGEEQTGVTLHKMDKGIDTGPTIAQSIIKIEDADTGRSLYDKCTAYAVHLFRDNYKSILDGNFTLHPQSQEDEYFSRDSIDFAEVIRPAGKSRELFNRIRACIFPPFQFPCVAMGDKLIQVYHVSHDVSLHGDGQIVTQDDSHYTVLMKDGAVRLWRHTS